MHLREIAESISTRKPVKGQVPFTSPRTGIHGVYEYIFTPVMNEAGDVEFVAGTTRDVSDHKRVEAEALDVRRKLDAALLAGEVGTFEWDVVNQRVWGDANFSHMFGIELDADGTAPLERYLTAIHSDDRPRVAEAIDRAIQDGRDIEIEYRVMSACSDRGGERWLLVRAKPERDNAGRVYRSAGVCLDVSGRKLAERELRKSTGLLRAISDSTGDVIYAKDLQGRLTYANPAAVRLIGKPLDAILGHTDAELLSDAAAASRVTENDRRVMSSGKPLEIEEVIPTPEGLHRV